MPALGWRSLLRSDGARSVTLYPRAVLVGDHGEVGCALVVAEKDAFALEPALAPVAAGPEAHLRAGLAVPGAAVAKSEDALLPVAVEVRIPDVRDRGFRLPHPHELVGGRDLVE